jgi:predicted metal-dependent hydrolase
MEMTGPLARQVHRAKGVLETRVLRGREHPPCALQLMDPAQPLQPSGVHEVLLRRLPRHPAWAAARDAKVSVDGIARQVDPGVLRTRLVHGPIITVTGLLAEGIVLFNSGRYWDAHEVWEREWTPDRKGPDSGFYKGLIQIAAGCLHYTRRNRRGAVNKWRSGASYLRPYLPAHKGVSLTPLVGAVEGYLAAMSDREWPDLEMPTIAQG